MSLWKHKKKKVIKKYDGIIQENQEECIKLIEEGFLKEIFNEYITDVSYNGKDFYAQDNQKGRYKLNINVSSEDVLSTIKKIANYMLQPFSNKNPSLDVAFGNYRLNAIHPSIARNNNLKVITFSLRKITATLKIKENDPTLCPIEVHRLLKCLILSYQSILISGQTGSGKTELQKYVISLMNPKDRIILIEESYETHIKEIYNYMDITSWIVNNQNDELAMLVKLALRNNPDWLLIAETRGIEAYDMIQAVMTGHSAITTLHSESAKYSLNRISQMCKKSIDFDETMMLANIAKHIKIGIHLEKKYDLSNERLYRRITEIVEYIPCEKGYEINTLFEIVKNEKLKESFQFHPISDELKKIFIKYDIDLTNIKKFLKEGEKNAKKNNK